ncbi:adenylate cyclase [Massospora cicadina]|nr:adenylate cyclase [Massospora cicadina]
MVHVALRYLLFYSLIDGGIASPQAYFTLHAELPTDPNLSTRPLNKLMEYISIDTSRPSPNYGEALSFLSKYAKELGLVFRTFKCGPNDPSTGILTWKGRDPSLPSILLNSHTDVVPANPQEWKFDPFNATLSVDDEGRRILVGRGSQDCKSLGIMYLEAVRNLLKLFPAGPLRTLHLTFVPDEEVGGERGMGCLATSAKFEELFGEIGLVFDEGEEIVHQITAKGNSGHASQFINDLATDKLLGFEIRARIFRYIEERRMTNQLLPLGDVTTINLDRIKVGSALNVVPGVAEAWYDVRVTPLADLGALQSMFRQWASKSGVELEFLRNDTFHSTNLTSNAFWGKIEETALDLHLSLKLAVFPAATDSRHLRKLGIPAVGLTPISQHKTQAHAIDESIRLDAFYYGIKFYTTLLPKLLSA